MKFKPYFPVPMAAALLLTLIALVVTPAHAMKIRNQNLTQLISDSSSIVFGTVDKVTDGIDAKGVPYTEVTIHVGSDAKGKIADGATYSFRQFGLLTPRKMANGKAFIALRPEGFPRWIEGETVVAFLREPASITGLQTTAGMGQGKLSMVNGKLINEYQNAGMFDGVDIDSSLLTSEQQNMLLNPRAIDASAFIDLVGRAVSEQWIEKGVLK
jgi:hypothetical protein